MLLLQFVDCIFAGLPTRPFCLPYHLAGDVRERWVHRRDLCCSHSIRPSAQFGDLQHERGHTTETVQPFPARHRVRAKNVGSGSRPHDGVHVSGEQRVQRGLAWIEVAAKVSVCGNMCEVACQPLF